MEYCICDILRASSLAFALFFSIWTVLIAIRYIGDILLVSSKIQSGKAYSFTISGNAAVWMGLLSSICWGAYVFFTTISSFVY